MTISCPYLKVKPNENDLPSESSIEHIEHIEKMSDKSTNIDLKQKSDDSIEDGIDAVCTESNYAGEPKKADDKVRLILEINIFTNRCNFWFLNEMKSACFCFRFR